MLKRVIGGALMACAVTATSAAETVSLHGAGSLKAAMGDIADAFERNDGIRVARAFGPSGLLRERIEGGEAAQIFASANMQHPQALSEAGKSGPVALFARNRLCALAQPEFAVDASTLLDVLLDPETRVGTSTPKADPSGDYAWQMFALAEAIRPGAQEALEAKAMQLTGGPESPKPPEGRSTYGWLMEEDRADIFLTYCTNAVLARREVPDLQIVSLPEALAVGADYSLTVLNDAPPDAWRLAFYILSPAGQKILADYGFQAPGAPAAE